jgi:hypothetical protein
MRPCIVPQHENTEGLAVGKIAKWPARLTTPSERLKLVASKVQVFEADTRKWKDRVRHYKQLWSEFKSDKIRNVMDMYTQFGGFAAALIDDPVWVMNVVSSYAANTLGIIYDRGLIGTVSDWYATLFLVPVLGGSLILLYTSSSQVFEHFQKSENPWFQLCFNFKSSE